MSSKVISKTLQDPEKGQAARSRLPSTAPTDAGINPQRSTDASTAGSEHTCRRACPMASAPGLPRARRADRLAGDEGDFFRLDPLARKEATKRHLCPRSSLRDARVSRIEMLTRALPELRPDASPEEQPEGAQPSVARRPANVLSGLPSHQA